MTSPRPVAIAHESAFVNNYYQQVQPKQLSRTDYSESLYRWLHNVLPKSVNYLTHDVHFAEFSKNSQISYFSTGHSNGH